MKNSITKQDVDEVMNNSEFVYHTDFEKNLVGSMKMPNGFIITIASACVDKENYSIKIGKEILHERFENKVWELLGFALQQKVYESRQK
jgi:hypothetical protein